MKTVIKIEIVLLVLLLLVGVGLTVAAGGGNPFADPVLVQPQPVAVPTDPVETTALPVEPVTEPVPEQAPIQVSATKYFAYDIRRDTYLTIQGSGSEKLYPASITKLLTAYVAAQYLQSTDMVQVGDALALVAQDSSVAGLKEGDQLSADQLIAAMMLPSGNDAAQTTAAAAGRVIAGDSSLSCEKAVEVFVEEMNRQAQALGMVNSHFANPDGYHDDNHYTTMDDLVILCKKVLAEPRVLACASRAEDKAELSGRTVEWKNTNHLLDSESDYYAPNAIGLKTGYTGKAGNCLVSAFFMEDRLWLIGVFGCPAFTEDRYRDTITIYNSLL